MYSYKTYTYIADQVIFNSDDIRTDRSRVFGSRESMIKIPPLLARASDVEGEARVEWI